MLRILLAAVLLLTLIGPVAGQATDTCIRVHIIFAADEDTELSGKVGVRWDSTDRREVGFVDFWIAEAEIDAGEDYTVGAFNIVGVSQFKMSFNDAELTIDGDGEFKTRRTDCSYTLPTDDGRLNLDDPASLAIVYANSKTGGYDVYLVNPATGGGMLAVRATRAQVDAALAAATAAGGSNTRIGEGYGVSLWALTSDECQRNAFYPDGKPDVFVFACDS